MMLYEQVELKKMIAYIGIDVGKQFLDICYMSSNTTTKFKSKQFNNQKADFKNMSRWIKTSLISPGEILITVEATGVYHEAIVNFLHKEGFNIFVSNSGRAKKFAQSLGLLHKTNKSDAAMLAKYGSLQTNDLYLWKPEPPQSREIKALVRRLNALEKDYQRESNRLEASSISGASNYVIESIRRMILILKTEIKELHKVIDDLIDGNPEMKENHKLLLTIVGIGSVMARELTCLFSTKSFNNAKQVAAYVGLIPKLNESGIFKGRTSLSKSGPSRIRSKLYLVAVSASKYNPDIAAQNDRLIRAGKSKIQALGAAMRN
jgi:transposase